MGGPALREILTAIYNAASDKKASEIVMLDLRRLTSITNYFFICTGESVVQVKAITDGIVEKLKEKKIRPWYEEGTGDSMWALLDYGQVIVHVFLGESREFYNLEGLWADAPQVRASQDNA